MNPWCPSLLELLRAIARFCIWLCLVLVALMTGVFAVAFAYRFLIALWGLCLRKLFAQPW